jgi:hypothetical protein
MLLAVVMTGILRVCAFADADDFFIPQKFAGQWTLVTNQDTTITATENILSRRGLEVFHRVLLLKTVIEEIPSQTQKASESEIRNFINNYRPPPIPYTSDETALITGREKFNCLEFANDIVAQASSNGIASEIIGIKFKDMPIGHACAGFPTDDGRMLYFDSTPGSGHISWKAYEAWVALDSPYRRADGGKLAERAGNLPITEIIPVSALAEIAGSLLEDPGNGKPPPPTRLMVMSEQNVQASGIEYAGPDSLDISTNQLAKWNQAAEEFMTAKASQEEAQKRAAQSKAGRLAAKALQENEVLAGQNDAFGQLRMGERYFSGDGVEMNLMKARAYLQQAADQGSPTAKEELKLLENPER